MEQQYRMNQDNINRKRYPKPENRFMRIWGPLFVKWGISMAVSLAAIFLFELVVLMRDNGLTITALQDMAKISEILEKYMESASATAAFTNEIMEEFLKYSTPVEGVSALITIPVLLVMFHKDSIRARIAGIMQNNKASLWKYSFIVVMMVALTVGVNNLLNLSGLAGASEEFEQTMNALYSASLPAQIICLGILVPICEELVFRGLMFRRIRQGDTFLRAALYSSVVFAFLHVNMVQMIYGFLLGMAFSWLYEKYGSVKAPILAHAAANLTSVFMTYAGTMEWLLKDELRMGIVTVLCATVASTMYVLVQRIEEKPVQEQEEVKN